MSRRSEDTRWSSERAFILAAAAGALGLGNLWRFPYMVGENGGASFIVAYMIILLSVGLPLMILEITAGRQARGGPVAMFRLLHPRAAPVGWFVVALITVIMSYYLVVTGWTLGYAWSSLADELVPFAQFRSGYGSLWWFLAVSGLTGLVVQTGVSGIERKAKYLTPMLVVMVFGLAAYGLTLKGRQEAMTFLLAPDWSSLRQPSLWLYAFGQVFYSLAIGQGFLITYGSELPANVSPVRSAVAVSGLGVAVSLLAGWMMFPLVFSFGFAPDVGSELAFTILPAVFAQLGSGRILAVLFFTLFFAAALSSCVAGIKVIATTLNEEFSVTYTRSVWVTIAGIVALGIPSALSYTAVDLSLGGRPVLEVMDMFTATQVVVTSGIVGSGLISWLLPPERLVDRLEERYRWLGHLMVAIGRYLALPVAGALLYSWLR